MDSGTPEKSTVRLNIFNQTYTLRVAGDPEEIEQAAHEVDELMNTIARAGNVDSTRIAVLACLHLQDRLRSLEKEMSQLKRDVEVRARTLNELLDEVI